MNGEVNQTTSRKKVWIVGDGGLAAYLASEFQKNSVGADLALNFGGLITFGESEGGGGKKKIRLRYLGGASAANLATLANAEFDCPMSSMRSLVEVGENRAVQGSGAASVLADQCEYFFFLAYSLSYPGLHHTQFIQATERLLKQDVRVHLIACQNGLGVSASLLGVNSSLHGQNSLSRTSGGLSLSRATAWLGVKVTERSENSIDVQINGESHFEFAGSDVAATVFQSLMKRVAVHRYSNPEEVEWRKVFGNTVINVICSIEDARNGVVAEDLALQRLARQLLLEAVSVANHRAVHFEVDEVVDLVFQLARSTGQNINSTLNALRNGRTTELRWIIGQWMSWAKEVRVATPVADGLLVRLIERWPRLIGEKIAE